MKFKLVVFDWDGTLMDSTSLIARCVRSACKDANLLDPGDAAALYVIGLGLVEALRHVAPDISLAQVEFVAERYRYHYLHSGGSLSLFASAKPLLELLHSSGVALAVATGKSRVGLNQALQAHSLDKFFAATRCADECHSKPHPQMLHELMDELMVEPANVLMVGDTTHDLDMARAAGVCGVAVTTGAHGVELLQKSRPHLCFDSLESLQPWLLQHIGLENG
ncbi:MAG: HAD-IA family hydrolase [Burkholderiaceae bacterium]|jgi:phosphoglycolate phosphatase